MSYVQVRIIALSKAPDKNPLVPIVMSIVPPSFHLISLPNSLTTHSYYIYLNSSSLVHTYLRYTDFRIEIRRENFDTLFYHL